MTRQRLYQLRKQTEKRCIYCASTELATSHRCSSCNEKRNKQRQVSRQKKQIAKKAGSEKPATTFTAKQWKENLAKLKAT